MFQAVAKLNIAEIAQEIFEQTYLQPFNGFSKLNLYAPPIERPIHGAMHAARVAAFIKILIILCQVCGIKEALDLTPVDIIVLQIVGLYHDAARLNDGADYWEQQSAKLCEEYLTKIIGPESAKEYASLISNKTNVGFCGKLLQSADCLDIIRCKSEFDIRRVSLYQDNYYNNNFREVFKEIVREVHALIEFQHDLEFDCTVDIDGEKITRHATPWGIRQSPVKLGYEQAENCYDKITSDFNKFPFINAYFKVEPKSLRAASLWKDASMKKPEVFPEKFLIKSVRSEVREFANTFVYDFWRHFIYGITKTSNDQTAHDLDLRLGDKKRFTVTGDGVFERAKKEPQYTPEQKRGYSQPQSTSYATRDRPSPLFSFFGEQKKVVGVLFPLDPANVLLTNRLMIYDGGTVGRGYDFKDQSEANEYFQNHAATLFPCDKFAEFEQAVNDASGNSKHNEVLARLRWTKGCKIIIGTNDLESRLLAQDRARTLKARLQEQAGELGEALDDDCQIPLIFYMPYTEMHGSEYTQDMQRQDRRFANRIYQSKEQRRKKYKSLDFEFLLGLDEHQIEFLLKSETYDAIIPLFLNILLAGYVHIARSLLELVPGSEEFLQKQLSGWEETKDKAYEHVLRAQDEKIAALLQSSIKPRGKFSQMFAEERPHPLHGVLSASATQGRLKHGQWLAQFADEKELGISLTQAFLNALHAKNFEIAQYVIQERGFNPKAKTTTGKTMLHVAASFGVFTICQLLVEKGADLSAVDKKGHTPLDYVIKHGNMTPDEIMQLLKSGLENYLKEMKERGEDFKPNNRILKPFASFGYGYSKKDKIEAAEYMDDLLNNKETEKTCKYADGSEKERMQGILGNGRLAGFWRAYHGYLALADRRPREGGDL